MMAQISILGHNEQAAQDESDGQTHKSQFCNSLILAHSHSKSKMDLLDLASRQRWSSLAARAVSHPEEIRLSDPSGLTPLHWCSFNRPPLSVIRAMLDNAQNDENNDGNNLLPPLVCLADVHGTTPLHAACSSHASPEVIQALVDSHPPSILIQDEMGWTALHYLTGTAFAS